MSQHSVLEKAKDLFKDKWFQRCDLDDRVDINKSSLTICLRKLYKNNFLLRRKKYVHKNVARYEYMVIREGMVMDNDNIKCRKCCKIKHIDKFGYKSSICDRCYREHIKKTDKMFKNIIRTGRTDGKRINKTDKKV